MFEQVADKLVTEDTPTSQTQVDSIDVSGEVGWLQANTAHRTGRETPAEQSPHRLSILLGERRSGSTSRGWWMASCLLRETAVENGIPQLSQLCWLGPTDRSSPLLESGVSSGVLCNLWICFFRWPYLTNVRGHRGHSNRSARPTLEPPQTDLRSSLIRSMEQS